MSGAFFAAVAAETLGRCVAGFVALAAGVAVTVGGDAGDAGNCGAGVGFAGACARAACASW